MTGWISAAATRRGTAHARRGEPRQDAVRVRHCGADGAVLVAVVADGAGSAPRGGAGAVVACRALCALAQEAVAAAPLSTLDPGHVAPWFDAARRTIVAAAAARDLAPRAFATTALLALSDGATTLTAHVGDGAAVARVAGAWTALSWPAAGEHAGTTHFLTDPSPAPRLARTEEPVSALALLTDGMERLVLDFAAREAHAPFFDMVAAPLDALAAEGTEGGRDRRLSAALARYLDGETVCERTDDDKTLAIAVQRGSPA
jgi:hypothetical protein